MPTWVLLIVMSLTTYRCTRLITTDDFPPLLWVRDRVCGGWRPMTQQELDRNTPSTPDQREHAGVLLTYKRRASWSPYWLAKLVSCAWCASGWVAGLLTLAVDLRVGLPDPWLAGPAVWAVGALLASREWA